MKITLDLDSTLCNFAETWNVWLYETGYTKTILSTEDITAYDWYSKNHGEESKNFFLDNPHHCYRLIQPYEGAKEFIDHCKENYDHVEILTHSDNDRTSSAKINFCINHFDFHDVKFFNVMSDKYKQTSGRVLVDDYPHHIINHTGHNKSHGILFDYQEKFGWSKLSNYRNLLHIINPDMRYIKHAYNYDDVITHLNNIKESK